jgi:hypothetical protein
VTAAVTAMIAVSVVPALGIMLRVNLSLHHSLSQRWRYWMSSFACLISAPNILRILVCNSISGSGGALALLPKNIHGVSIKTSSDLVGSVGLGGVLRPTRGKWLTKKREGAQRPHRRRRPHIACSTRRNRASGLAGLRGGGQ